MESREGQRVPEVTFKTRRDGAWAEITSSDIFAGKTVVVFSLPGAFTPTCSSTHLPRYDELAPVFRKLGVDDVVCVSVNDAFVMDAWAREEGTSQVRMLPDGSGKFTEAMGMLVDKDDLGFGRRSWRYSMLVKDGVIEKMFIEPEKPGDPFEVSDADSMLRYLSPEAKPERAVTVFTRPGCPHCIRAKELLARKEIRFEEIILGKDITTRTLQAVTARATVPQVFIDGKHIGGAADLEKYLARTRNGGADQPHPVEPSLRQLVMP